MKKKDELKKNYAILIGTIILVICACYAFYNVYNIYTKSQISTSPLKEETRGVLYDDLSIKLTDLDADTFLIVSFKENINVYKNEKEIKKFLAKKDLLDNVIYLDVTDYKDNEGFIDELNKKLSLTEKKKIDKLPALIYYKNGELTYTKDSKSSLLSIDDFEQLIDMYELAS